MNLSFLPILLAACIDHQGGAYIRSGENPVVLTCENAHCSLPNSMEVPKESFRGKVREIQSESANELLEILRPIVEGTNSIDESVIYAVPGTIVVCSGPITKEEFEEKKIRTLLREFLVNTPQ